VRARGDGAALRVIEDENCEIPSNVVCSHVPSLSKINLLGSRMMFPLHVRSDKRSGSVQWTPTIRTHALSSSENARGALRIREAASRRHNSYTLFHAHRPRISVSVSFVVLLFPSGRTLAVRDVAQSFVTRETVSKSRPSRRISRRPEINPPAAGPAPKTERTH
jgi:hypothetical protein